MAITYFPNEWSGTAAYTAGDSVNYAGTAYEARNNIAAPSDGNNSTPFDDQTNWKVTHIVAINTIYSLIEAAILQINNNNPAIKGSMPMFVQLAEASFSMDLRIPAQIDTDVLTVDSEGKVRTPQALIGIKNVELLSNDNGDDNFYDNRLLNEARYQMISYNRYEYQRVKIQYNSDAINLYQRDTGIRSAGYWWDGEFLHTVPTLGSGSQIRIVGEYQLTPLGHSILLTNSSGVAINDEGQTEADWVAEGNDAADFVQATGIQETNTFLQTAPNLYLYGTIMKAEQYLKDDARWPLWEQQFNKAKEEVEMLVDRFEDMQPSTLYFESHYPLG